MTQVWRLRIKTDAEKGIDPHGFCIERNILGIGWRVEHGNDNLDWETYVKLGEDWYLKKGDKGWRPAINAIKQGMQKNDLCWTRNPQGIYYLGRIMSEWRYQGGRDFEAADVVNIRDCNWIEVGRAYSVPGKIVNSFIPRRVVQRVEGDMILAYSMYKWNMNSKEPNYKLPPIEPDIFSLLSSDGCEDLVALYLQSIGYYLIPSSCKISTPEYEYFLKHAVTAKRAAAQVKNGKDPLSINDYANFDGEVYLFTSHGNYIGDWTDPRNTDSELGCIVQMI